MVYELISCSYCQKSTECHKTSSKRPGGPLLIRSQAANHYNFLGPYVKYQRGWEMLCCNQTGRGAYNLGNQRCPFHFIAIQAPIDKSMSFAVVQQKSFYFLLRLLMTHAISTYVCTYMK